MHDPSRSYSAALAWHDVTLREWQLLLLLADDLDNHDIASRICISVKSVRNYRNRLGVSLNQQGPGALARYARLNRCLVRKMYQLHTGNYPLPLP